MRERNGQRWAWIGVALGLAAGLAGCSDRTPAPVPVTASGLTGTWVEFVEKVDTSDPRISAPPELKVFRKITLNEDGTFSMILLDKRQKPIEGAKVAGTWTVGPRMIDFSLTENTLKGEDADLAPSDSSGVLKNPDGEERLVIYGQNGWQGTFKRAN